MIRKKDYNKKPIIDLTGPDGNAFMLMGRAMKYAKQLELDGNKITEEMRAGDYEHLIQVFEKYFGEYVILER